MYTIIIMNPLLIWESHEKNRLIIILKLMLHVNRDREGGIYIYMNEEAESNTSITLEAGTRKVHFTVTL